MRAIQKRNQRKVMLQRISKSSSKCNFAFKKETFETRVLEKRERKKKIFHLYLPTVAMAVKGHP